MSLSDRFRSMMNKKGTPNKESETPASTPKAPPPPSPHPSPTLEELGQQIHQERTQGEAKQQGVDKEIQVIRTNLEKIEASAKSARETQNQTLQFLQQDAE